MDFKAKTIKQKLSFEGIGIHTGKFSKVILEPYDKDRKSTRLNSSH